MKNRTWDELRSYCYKVASAVGLILIEIYGYEDRAARLHAIDLGIQMQLINVLRDINEDMERGRVYLPLDILASHDMTLDQLQSPGIAQTAAWRGFIIEYVDMIKRHQESANQLFGYLDARAHTKTISPSTLTALHKCWPPSGAMKCAPRVLQERVSVCGKGVDGVAPSGKARSCPFCLAAGGCAGYPG